MYKLLRLSHVFAEAVRATLDQVPLDSLGLGSLGSGQLRLLRVLRVEGSLPVGEAARELGITPSGISKAVTGLERCGLATRLPVRGDRRCVDLTVSLRGHDALRAYEGLESKLFRQAMEDFDPEEIRECCEFLGRMILALSRQAGPARERCLWCGARWDDDCVLVAEPAGCPHQQLASSKRPDRDDDHD